MKKTINNKKTNLIIALLLVFSIVLSSCTQEGTALESGEVQNIEIENTARGPQHTAGASVQQNESNVENTTYEEIEFEEFYEEDLVADYDEEDSTSILLNDDGIQIQGDGAEVSGNTINITAGGIYIIQGSLEDGGIVVNSEDEDTVRLILDNVDIINTKGSPINIQESKKTIVTLVEGSINTITDGISYSVLDDSEEPNAALFSKDDLVINGSGTLIVNGNYMHGINSKDGLKIIDASVDVTASIDGIKGKDYAIIQNASISINAQDDGIQSDIYLTFDGSDIEITESYEGIEGQVININSGNFYITASDDGLNSTGEGRLEININGGYIYLDTATGDGMDANGYITMTDGTVVINGPVTEREGAIDYDYSFNLTGGLLIASGFSQMSQAPVDTSTQNTIYMNTDLMSAGTLIHIETSEGEEVLTYTPDKEFESLVFSSSDLKTGETYLIYTGGSYEGNEIKGVYSGGTYTRGTLFEEVEITEIITTVGYVIEIQPGPGQGFGNNGPGNMLEGFERESLKDLD